MANPAVILVGAVVVGGLAWWFTRGNANAGGGPPLGTVINTLPAGSVFIGNEGDGDQYRDPDGIIWLQRFDGKWERIA